MIDLIQNIVSSIFKMIGDTVINFAVGIFENIINVINFFAVSIWDNAYVEALITASLYAAFIVLGFSLILLIVNIMENAEKIDLKLVFSSLIKGFMFATMSHYLAQVIFTLALEFVKQLNMSITASDIVSLDWALLFPNFGTLYIIAFLVIIICAVCFLIMTILNTAMVLVITVSAFLYVPFVVLGDSSKASEWFNQIISLSVTYVLRYICFYLGIALVISGDIVGFIFIFAIFVVPKALQKFGYSSGASSLISKTTNTISMTARSLGGFIK